MLQRRTVQPPPLSYRPLPYPPEPASLAEEAGGDGQFGWLLLAAEAGGDGQLGRLPLAAEAGGDGQLGRLPLAAEAGGDGQLGKLPLAADAGPHGGVGRPGLARAAACQVPASSLAGPLKVPDSVPSSAVVPTPVITA